MAHLKEVLYYRVGRKDILSSFERLVDQTRNTTFSPDDLKTWPGQILHLSGSEDVAATPEKRDTMQALYPRARMHIIQGADHAAAVSHQEEYFRVIDTFLAE
jgi:pimeloyl-ACP methyl ester carboxylesterase